MNLLITKTSRHPLDMKDILLLFEIEFGLQLLVLFSHFVEYTNRVV